MHKVILTILLLSICINSLNAQYLQWANNFGNTGQDNGLAIVSDSLENIYAVGRFSGIVDFDPSQNTKNLTSYGAMDIYLAKYNKDGLLIWVKQIGGIKNDVSDLIHIDIFGNIYIIGTFSASISFEKSGDTLVLNPNGGNDIFFGKYDNNGELIWAKSIGGSGNDFGRAIGVDRFGNVYISGYFKNIVDFDPSTSVHNLVCSNDFCCYLAKYDQNGNYIWAFNFTSTGANYGIAFEIDKSDHIYFSGYYHQTIDLDNGDSAQLFTSAGSTDVFLTKFTLEGSLVWAKDIKGINLDYPTSLHIDNIENIYLSGGYTDTLRFIDTLNPKMLISNGYLGDFFLAKYSCDGNLIWARSDAGFKSEGISAFSICQNQFLYVTGGFQDTIYFETGNNSESIISKGLSDIYLAKYNTDGDFIWVKSIGGINDDYVYSITSTDSLNVFITGWFSSLLNFSTLNDSYILTSNGFVDSYIANFSPIIRDSINEYICKDNNYFFYDDTLNNEGVYSKTQNCGIDCDSIITLILNIFHVDTTYEYLSINIGDSVFLQNAWRNTSGTYFSNLQTINGCDSIIKIQLSINNPPLPINILSSKIICTQTGSLITWSTASETNNDYFTVEKTTDLKEWKLISTIYSSFDSKEIKNYEVTDNKLVSDQLTYYRLKQTDKDGTFKYFDVQSILCSLPNNFLEIIGVNVSDKNVNIIIKTNGLDSVFLNLFDINGKLLSQKTIFPVKGANIITLNANELSLGTYLVSVVQNNEKKTKKIILN